MNYEIRRREDDKYAVFDVNGKMISPDWFDWIREDGLVKGGSPYYIAVKDGKKAIFDKYGNQITEWFDGIWLDGLVRGESEYYIASKHGRWAIFHKDGSQISGWFYAISSVGLVSGKSEYYIVESYGKVAIFHKDGRQISEWFGWIGADGLLSGKSEYYLVRDKGKEAIFDVNGNMITPDWFNEILPYGLVKGECDYYITCSDIYRCAVYHKNGQKVSDDFTRDYVKYADRITFNEKVGIVEIEKYNGTIKSIEFFPVIHKKEEFLDYTKLLNI
jgi:hypothetical protein